MTEWVAETRKQLVQVSRTILLLMVVRDITQYYVTVSIMMRCHMASKHSMAACLMVVLVVVVVVVVMVLLQVPNAVEWKCRQ
jgi:hypothetical protein